MLPDGTIEHYQHGKLIKRTLPNANGQPPAKAKAKPKTPASKPAAAPQGPTPGEAYHVAKLGTKDIWQFLPESAAPDSHVLVRHYKSYDLLREHRRSATFAQKLGFQEQSPENLR